MVGTSGGTSVAPDADRRGVVAVAVLSVAACSDSGDSGGSASESTTEADEPSETHRVGAPTATGELAGRVSTSASCRPTCWFGVGKPRS